MSSALKQNKTNTIKYSDDLEVQNICTQVELFQQAQLTKNCNNNVILIYIIFLCGVRDKQNIHKK